MHKSFVREYKLSSLEKILSGVLLVLGIGMMVIIHTSSWFSPTKSIINNPGFFPQIVAGGFCLMGVILFLYSLKPGRKEMAVINWFGVLIVAVWVVFAVACNYLGFVLSGILVLFATFVLFGAKNKKAVILTSILAPVILYLTLGVMLGVNMPTLFL